MRNYSFKYLFIITILIVFNACSSDKQNIVDEFNQLGIKLSGDFDIEKNEWHSSTDYVLSIQIVLDSSDFNTVSDFIRDQPNFFIGDTTTDVQLFNNYPHLKGSSLTWHKYNAKEPSYEYFSIEADTSTNRVKYEYLDEG